ncbi:hypothetical protein FlaCF_0547 [Flavobacterium tructae]
MIYEKNFARAIWWRYWKQSQRFEQRRTPKVCGLPNFLTVLNYEYKHPFERNRIEVD